MFTLFKTAKQPSTTSTDSTELATQFNTTTRESPSPQELAELALSGAVGTYGIPKDWLNVEYFEVTRAPGFKEVHLQIVINRWSDQLMRYSAALQQQFEAELSHFGPDIDHSHHIISWRFSDTCELPSALIPDGIAWHVSANLSK